MVEQRRPTGGWRVLSVVALTALVVGLSIAIGIGGRAIWTGASGSQSGAGAQAVVSSSTPSGAGDEVTVKPLTLAAARGVYDAYQQAKDTSNADQFRDSTCAEFINADMELRGQKSVEDLLAVYVRAKRLVPVQFIDNPVVVGAQSSADKGTVQISAMVTDNRFVPPTQKQREITYAMSYEEGRWKFCPTTAPV